MSGWGFGMGSKIGLALTEASRKGTKVPHIVGGFFVLFDPKGGGQAVVWNLISETIATTVSLNGSGGAT